MRFTWLQRDRLEKLIREDLKKTKAVEGFEGSTSRWVSATTILDDLIYQTRRSKLVDAIGEEYTPTDASDWRRFEMLLPKVKRILEKLVKTGEVEKKIDLVLNINDRANRYKKLTKYFLKG